jgi:hypothetical protein
MFSPAGVFRVRCVGSTAVLSFAQGIVPNHFYHEEIRDDLHWLVRNLPCTTCAFEFQGVNSVSSGLFGLLTWLQQKGVGVRLLQPRPHIREALVALDLGHLVDMTHELDETPDLVETRG